MFIFLFMGLRPKGRELLIKRFYYFNSQTEGIDNTIEHSNARNDNSIFNLRDVRFCGVGTSCQLLLGHFSLLSCIQEYLTRIERISSFFCLNTLRCTFFAELGIKYGVIVNDFVIVCLHNMPL